MQLTPDEAALMLATLACSSDGQCDEAEEQVLRDRLAPNLNRLGRAGEDRTFARLYSLMGSRGPEWTLTTIREALPEKERVYALRTAVEIVRSDGTITREEMDHLAEVADELGLSEKQLQAAMLP